MKSNNKKQKKFYIILPIILALIFTTKAFASLTFTNSAITGTTASTIDLGSGHDLYLQTNGGKVGIGTTTPSSPLEVSGPGNGTAQFQITGSGTFPTGISFNDTTASNYPQYGMFQDHRLAINGFSDGTSMTFFVHNPNTGSYTWPFVMSNDRLTDQSSITFNKSLGTAVTTMQINTLTNVGGSAGISMWNTGTGIVLQVQGSLNVASNGFLGIGTTIPAAKIDIKDGHYASTQTTAPTASVTGTGYSGASMASGSTDTKGKITATVGANAGTLVVTFNSAYTTAPTCTTDPKTATAQADVGKMYSTESTTALTLNFIASPAGGSETWSYICLQ